MDLHLLILEINIKLLIKQGSNKKLYILQEYQNKYKEQYFYIKIKDMD
jgi:hypothetical protein